MSSNRKIKTFEDLKVWQKARELKNSIFKLTEDLPDEEHYRLKDQLQLILLKDMDAFIIKNIFSIVGKREAQYMKF